MKRSRHFPADRQSVPSARRFVTDAVSDLPDDVSDSIALIATELASNSVRHAASAFEVTIEQLPDRIRIEVVDDGEGEPVVMSPGPTDTSGRGLRIVKALADGWGVIPKRDASGKTVWVTLTVPPAEETGVHQAGHRRRSQGSTARRRPGAPGTGASVMSVSSSWWAHHWSAPDLGVTTRLFASSPLVAAAARGGGASGGASAQPWPPTRRSM